MMFVPVLKLQGYHNGYHLHPHHHHHQKKLGVSYPPHPRRIHTTCTNASSSECVDPSPNPIISKSGLDVTTCDDLLHTPSSVSFPSISSVPFISSSSSSLTSQDASSAALQWTQEAENGIEKVDFLLFKISPFYFSCNVIDSDIYTHTYTYTYTQIHIHRHIFVDESLSSSLYTHITILSHRLSSTSDSSLSWRSPDLWLDPSSAS